ncbi:DNA replication complex subunit Gins51 [Halogranum rubrum]|uniref:Gins51 C-terminal domain-containing protein n=1 Tax=Halogranum salarium B-1 TaxID=1210908 RepID=J2ZE84_9EURY|nr:hypothetical protein [Halogranum salarium]EJN58980.1 hypothetical protein HSB1_24010 [Halogranum salarium B-1]
MNLDELRTVQSKERRKDSLQHLRDSFYGDVADYIAALKEERNGAAEQADDPFSSPEVSRLTDEIETAEEVVEAVYERRVGKVVKLASFAAADMPVDDDGMTAEEKALFDDLVTRIETNKTNVLDILAGKRRPGEVQTESPAASEPSDATPTTSETSETTAATESERERTEPRPAETSPTDEMAETSETTESPGVLADVMGSGESGTSDDETAGESGHTPVEPEAAPPGAGSDETAPSPSENRSTDEATASEPEPEPESAGSDTLDDDHERTTVRITQDVGAIFGVDEREYDLVKEDIVTLPTTNAEPLIQREAAERLD